jgi:hypothetical protein
MTDGNVDVSDGSRLSRHDCPTCGPRTLYQGHTCVHCGHRLRVAVATVKAKKRDWMASRKARVRKVAAA